MTRRGELTPAYQQLDSVVCKSIMTGQWHCEGKGEVLDNFTNTRAVGVESARCQEQMTNTFTDFQAITGISNNNSFQFGTVLEYMTF